MPGNSDPFYGQPPSQIGPYSHAEAIVPSDTSNVTVPYRAIWVGQGGNIKLMPRDHRNQQAPVPVTLLSVQSGQLLPVWTLKVYATGTTAASLVGLW